MAIVLDQYMGHAEEEVCRAHEEITLKNPLIEELLYRLAQRYYLLRYLERKLDSSILKNEKVELSIDLHARKEEVSRLDD